MAPPSSVPANAAAVAGRGGSECRICPNPRLTAVAGSRPTPPFYPFLSFFFIHRSELKVLRFLHYLADFRCSLIISLRFFANAAETQFKSYIFRRNLHRILPTFWEIQDKFIAGSQGVSRTA